MFARWPGYMQLCFLDGILFSDLQPLYIGKHVFLLMLLCNSSLYDSFQTSFVTELCPTSQVHSYCTASQVHSYCTASLSATGCYVSHLHAVPCYTLKVLLAQAAVLKTALLIYNFQLSSYTCPHAEVFKQSTHLRVGKCSIPCVTMCGHTHR